MHFETKYKILLQKRYFDKGMSVLHYVRWMILFFGVSSLDPKTTISLGFGYIAVCYILGRAWYKYNWVEPEQEIGNRYDLFVKEMRTHVKKKKKV